MMADELRVDLIGGNVSLPALLEQLDTQLHVADASALAAQRSFQALGAGNATAALSEMDAALGKVSADTASGTQASLASAQAEARLAVAVGDHAGAIGILEAALATQAERTDGVIRAEIQLTGVENALIAKQEAAAAAAAAEAAALAEEQAAASGMAGATSAAASAAGALGIAFGAVQIGKIAIGLAEDGAASVRTETAFNNLAKTAGTTGDALLAALRSASGGEISDMNLELDASKAEFLGVAKNAGDFSTLLAIARNNAQQMGLTTKEAFDLLINGLDKGAPRMLKQVGLNIDAKAANEAYALSIGKSVAQLDAEEKKQALVAAVMQQGIAQIKATGGAVDGLAAGQDRLGASFDNLKNKVGANLASAIAPSVNALSDLANGFDGTAQTAARWIEAVQSIQRSIQGLPPASAQAQAANQSFATGLLEWIGVAHQATAAEQALAASAAQVAPPQQTAADTAAQVAAAETNAANAMELVGVQSRAAAQAAQQKGDADQVAAVNAQTHAVAQQQLAAAAQTAAQALLANGSAGAATAAQLAGSSSQVDVLTAAYYRLAAAQAAAGAAKANAAALAEQRSGERDPGTSGADESAKAEDRNLQALYRTLEDAPKKAKAAGAAKISDQQKLNNTLSADQVAADNKSSDQEQKHRDKLLAIQKTFDAASLAQQQSNEVSKRQSQADFYDRLTSSDLNKKKGGSDALKKIDADYQAAYKKSQELAAAGNQKEAADYLALKQKQAEEALSYEEAIAKATDAKDKAEVTRLQAIQKLRLATQAEEEKQLLAKGDPNVNAKQKALDDESANNQNAQEKIATAAERTSERQITAAEKAGKKIDENTARVTKLGAAYDKIPPSAGGGAPATRAGGGGAAGDTGASPAAPGDDPVVAALSALGERIVAAINAEIAATKDGASKVASAVGRISSSPAVG